MNRVLVLAVLAILAPIAPARAQDVEQNREWCANQSDTVDPELAIGACTALIQSRRLNAQGLAIAYNNRGASFARVGQYDHAIADYDQATRLDPRYAIAYYNRGVAYERKGQYGRAIAEHDRAIGLDPDYANALNGRCWSRAILGELEAAREDCDRALRLRPGHAGTLDSRGLVHLKSGDHLAALADYTDALAADGTLGHAAYGSALARRALGNLAEAEADFQAALLSAPDAADKYRAYNLPAGLLP